MVKERGDIECFDLIEFEFNGELVTGSVENVYWSQDAVEAWYKSRKESTILCPKYVKFKDIHNVVGLKGSITFEEMVPRHKDGLEIIK